MAKLDVNKVRQAYKKIIKDKNDLIEKLERQIRQLENQLESQPKIAKEPRVRKKKVVEKTTPEDRRKALIEKMKEFRKTL